MLLLALETVTRAGSLAICDDAGACASMHGDARQPHGARLPSELLQFVAAHGHSLADVDAFVVVTGPGSFTGLRVGLATVQGLALAQRRTVIGVPTLDAMVSGWLDQQAPAEGLLAACLDGARGDVFYALYDVTGADRFEAATALIAPSVAPPSVAAAQMRAHANGRAMRMIGDGVERYADQFRAELPGVTIDSPMPNLADGAARLAHRRNTAGEAPHALRPIYIRRTDAELARERAAGADFTVIEVTDPAGLEEVAALHARVFKQDSSAAGLTWGDANRGIARVHAARSRTGELIGYSVVWLVIDELDIHNVAVDPAYRRTGVAKTLLERVLSEARASGATSATLEVRASNAPALALYEHFGFKQEGVRPAYYREPVEDALILWRRKL